MAKSVKSNQALNDLADGKNLVYNGDFSFGTAGWTIQSGTFDVVNGQLKSTSASSSLVQQAEGINSGSYYKVEAFIDNTSGTNVAYFDIGTSNAGFEIERYLVSAGQSATIETIVTGVNTIWVDCEASVADTIFDNISVKEIPKVMGVNIDEYAVEKTTQVMTSQAYSNETFSKTWNTDYTNNTALPIFVMITGATDSVGALLSFWLDGEVVMSQTQAVANYTMSFSVIVPVGSTYKFTFNAGSPAITDWYELR